MTMVSRTGTLARVTGDQRKMNALQVQEDQKVARKADLIRANMRRLQNRMDGLAHLSGTRKAD